MTAIWPGDELYAPTMEAAKKEYEAWLNRNKQEFIISKKASDEETIIEDDFDPYNAEMDGWSEKDWADEMDYN